MELDRQSIERKDFPAARRGYDPDAVDRHLRELADAVEELREQQRPARDVGAVASAAAEQVRAIVEAAEQTASQIQEKAEKEAKKLTGEAKKHARETRKKADADAAAHLQAVQEQTQEMIERAGSIDSEIDALLEDVRKSAATLAETLRQNVEALTEQIRQRGEELRSTLETRAGVLSADLDSMKSGLGEIGAARGGAGDGGEVTEVEFEEIDSPERAGVPDPDSPGEAQADEAPKPDPDAPSATAEGEDQPELDYGDDQDGYGEEDFASEVPAEESLEVPAGTTGSAPQPAPEGEGEASAEDAADESGAGDKPGDAAADAPQPEPASNGGEGARLIALNMALNGTPREETAKYLSDNFDLPNPDAILDDVYSRVEQG